MPSVLVVDDDPLVHHSLKRLFESMNVAVATAGSAADGVRAVEEHDPDVVLLDVRLPDANGLDAYERIRTLDAKRPVVFITSVGTSQTAIEAMKRGAFDFLVKPLDFGDVRKLVARAIEVRRLSSVRVRLAGDDEEDDANLAASGDCLIGHCPPMQEVYKSIGRVAPQDVTVLIRGESGTGKELAARAIQQHGQRADGPFLSVNCAAIPETLLESELFGHERGAFTGAHSQRIGKFEQCNGGTLFLDEIGDASPLVQSKLLRVLQDQRFQRVGGNDTVQTDVRIIAATNRDLEQMVAEKQFRADLFYRLSVFDIHLPPLRQRNGDLGELVRYFLQRYNRELGRQVFEVSLTAMDVLERHDWPGNVRELQSVVKQSLLRATGSVLLPDFLPPTLYQGPPPEGHHASGEPPESEADEEDDDEPLPVGRERFDLDGLVESRLEEGSETLHAEIIERVERRLITRVLKQTDGNQLQAARILGITRGSLRNKLRALGITIQRSVRTPQPGELDDASV